MTVSLIKPLIPLRSWASKFLPQRPEEAQVLRAFLEKPTEPSCMFPEHRSIVEMEELFSGASAADDDTTGNDAQKNHSNRQRRTKLRIAIGVPDAFSYGNLLHRTQRSTQWRSGLRKYCCLRTGVSWRYMATDKLVLVEAMRQPEKSLDRMVGNMNRAALVVQDWLAFETQRQALDVPERSQESLVPT